ncbi:hypothetical protein Tco_0963162 [Tanacetum coccineum]
MIAGSDVVMMDLINLLNHCNLMIRASLMNETIKGLDYKRLKDLLSFTEEEGFDKQLLLFKAVYTAKKVKTCRRLQGMVIDGSIFKRHKYEALKRKELFFGVDLE